MLKSKRKFTLITLFLGIAAMAVLSAILLLKYNTSLDRGRVAINKGRLKKVGTACILYAYDHDGEWPNAVTQLIPTYIAHGEIASLDGNIFTIETIATLDSPNTTICIQDNSIPGYINILYSDGKVVTTETAQRELDSSERDNSLRAPIPNTGSLDPKNAAFGIAPTDAWTQPYLGTDAMVAAMHKRDQLMYQHPLLNGTFDSSNANGEGGAVQFNVILDSINNTLLGTNGFGVIGYYNIGVTTYSLSDFRYEVHSNTCAGIDGIEGVINSITEDNGLLEQLFNASGLTSKQYHTLLEENGYNGPNIVIGTY